MLTIAITGSNGEVGKRTVLEALKDGHSVIGLDQGDEPLLAPGMDDELRKRFTYKQADLKNRDAFLGAARGSDAMIHLAAVFKKEGVPASSQLAEHVSRQRGHGTTEALAGVNVTGYPQLEHGHVMERARRRGRARAQARVARVEHQCNRPKYVEERARLTAQSSRNAPRFTTSRSTRSTRATRKTRIRYPNCMYWRTGMESPRLWAEHLGTRDEVRRRQTGVSEAHGLASGLDIGQRVRRDAHDRS